MDLTTLVITLISGIIGGNLAGVGLKEKSLGAGGNSIVGLIGGGAGHWLLQALGILASTATTAATSGTLPVPGTEGLDISMIIGNILGSGVGGAALTAIVAFLKQFIQEGGSGTSSEK